nr:uncharacterized protein LOC121830204 isoform X3 [Peromyscus maniculatus bairdii]
MVENDSRGGKAVWDQFSAFQDCDGFAFPWALLAATKIWNLVSWPCDECTYSPGICFKLSIKISTVLEKNGSTPWRGRPIRAFARLSVTQCSRERSLSFDTSQPRSRGAPAPSPDLHACQERA